MQIKSNPQQSRWLHMRRRQMAGQGLAEYALILSLVALAVIVIINLLEVSVSDLFARLVGQAPVAPPSLANYTPPPTYTPILTATPTATNDPNATATNTPTSTPTLTPSNTPTATNTPTSTPNFTPTPTCPSTYDTPQSILGTGIDMHRFRCGGPGVAFLESGTIDGGPGSGTFRPDAGLLGPDLFQTGNTNHLGALVANEWVEYLVSSNQNRMFILNVLVSSTNNNGRFRILIIRNGAVVFTSNSVTVPNTNGAWSTVSTEAVPLWSSGSNTLRFVVENGGFNVGGITGSQQGNIPPTATPTTIPCYTLNVAINPTFGGQVNLNPPANCGGGRYTQGTAVTLSATANAGYAFSNWSGNASGTNSNVTITMNSNANVTANFSQCRAVTTAVSPANSGNLSVSPAPNCGNLYIPGTILTFNATPREGYAFANWSGALSGNTRPATLVVSGAASVTANFALMPQITEGFESGNWSGGVGWNGPWNNPVNATVTNVNNPHNGSGFHLWMQGQGSVHRAANLSAYSEAILEFHWRINADAFTDYLYVEMSNNGSDWTIMATLDNRAGNDVYIWRQILIPGNFRNQNFQVRFRSNGNSATDYFYIDTIRILGTGY